MKCWTIAVVAKIVGTGVWITTEIWCCHLLPSGSVGLKWKPHWHWSKGLPQLKGRDTNTGTTSSSTAETGHKNEPYPPKYCMISWFFPPRTNLLFLGGDQSSMGCVGWIPTIPSLCQIWILPANNWNIRSYSEGKITWCHTNRHDIIKSVKMLVVNR